MNHESERPLHYDDKKIVDQIGHLLPQIHLTLISVLQGIVLGFLVNSFVRTVNFTDPNWIRNGIEIHHAYISYVASLVFIAFAWNEYAMGIFLFHWPVSAMQTLLSFIAASLEIFVMSVPDNIGLWSTGIGFIFIVAIVIRRRNQYIVSPELYRTPAEKEKNVPVKDLKFYAAAIYGSRYGDPLLHFIVAILLFLPIGLVYTFDPALVNWRIAVFQYQVNIVDFILPTIALVVFSANLSIEDHFFVYYAEGILKAYGSPYSMERGGKVSVREPEDRQGSSEQLLVHQGFGAPFPEPSIPVPEER